MIALVAVLVFSTLIRAGVWVAEEMPYRLLVAGDGFATIQFRVAAAPTKAKLAGLRPTKLPVFQARADGSVQRGMVIRRVEGERARMPSFVDWSKIEQRFRVHYSFATIQGENSEPQTRPKVPAVSLLHFGEKESEGVPIFYVTMESE